ncbi:hypothetical protein CDAR_265481 [Caerostris darwini]|uniref:Uncharacterized protein n=1 Tax=Caerostris darwini TaxID=1538125 RepID=A0AAV4RBS9_9ARAC|nr:hypothetical protein CDAR_265481 [Caerostris darwini]
MKCICCHPPTQCPPCPSNRNCLKPGHPWNKARPFLGQGGYRLGGAPLSGNRFRTERWARGSSDGELTPLGKRSRDFPFRRSLELLNLRFFFFFHDSFTSCSLLVAIRMSGDLDLRMGGEGGAANSCTSRSNGSPLFFFFMFVKLFNFESTLPLLNPLNHYPSSLKVENSVTFST